MTSHDSSSPHHGLAVPVDSARAEALRVRLHEQLVGRAALTPTQRPPAAERQEFTVHTHLAERRSHRLITIAAILVAVVGLAGVVAIATRNEVSTDAEPVSTLPPLPDHEIAAAALPHDDASGLPEYGEEWQSAMAIHTVEMRGDIAAEVPECAPFLDAFESSGRPAVVDAELAWHPDPPAALSSTYIVVFPDEIGAEAMFDATRDPRFIRECSPAYDQELYDATGQSLSQPGFSYFPFYNDRPVPGVTAGETYTDLDPLDLEVDEQWAVQLNYPSDTFQVTTVRIGRVVAVVQGSLTARTLGVDDTGRAVAEPAVIQTHEEYHAILRAVVQRTRDALAGIAPVQAG
jgi:hypothetical protein